MKDQQRKVPELNQIDLIKGTNLEKQRFIDNFYNGLVEYGFIVLNPYDFSFDLIDNAYNKYKQFFALPLATKMKYLGDNGGQRGYVPRLVEHAKNSKHPDLKEFWHIGRELPTDSLYKGSQHYPANIWPDIEVPNFKQVGLAVFKQLDQVATSLFHSLAQSLNVPESYFEEMTHEGNSILRTIHYPPLKEFTEQDSIRAGAHEDINLITLLVGATDGGLELLDRDGKWLSVPSLPNQIVVDSGDMLSRITNEVIPATTHRVINPDHCTSERYSMPFFCHPHANAELKCIASCIGAGKKYEDILAKDFLMQRLIEIGVLKVQG
ncbi:MAG: isopenicillin N synthase family oxygenase [Alcanivoracaceae bacterium]|nr:isopenicillin N synthase family oxygenase [Alcanivoracaceae bacterium]